MTLVCFYLKMITHVFSHIIWPVAGVVAELTKQKSILVNTMVNFQRAHSCRHIRAAFEFARISLVFSWNNSSRSMELRYVLFEAFFRVGYEFTIDVIRARKLSKRMISHHMIYQTIFKHVGGKFTMSLVPCAMNF